MGHDDTPAAERSQYLSFFLAEEEYAVGLLKVREIIQYDTLTRVPRTPPWIRGVINLRGGVVAVVDLAVKFGLPPTPVSETTCIVITETDLDGEQAVMGVLADSVSQVVELGPEEIEEPPAFGTQVHVDFLLGMGRAGKKFVLLLDTDKVLSAEELLSTTEVAAQAAEDQTNPEPPPEEPEDTPSGEKDVAPAEAGEV